MPIHFHKHLQKTRFLDPNRNYQDGSQTTEIRVDPLTGRTARILNFPVRVPPKPDLTPLVDASLQMGCPFCPEVVEKSTPKFPPDLVPEGRIKVGEALVFPNMFPYDTFSSVGIFSAQHYVPLLDFDEELLVNGFQACTEFFRQVQSQYAAYGSLNWNYMPQSGGSLVHPHIQVIAGDIPTNYQREALEAGVRYQRENGSIFWADLLRKEQETGERYIGSTGTVHWLASFAPLGFTDLMALFPGRNSLVELTRPELADFARGLRRVFAYFDGKGFWNFNLSVFSGLPGDESFWVHARIVPRFASVPLNTSDMRYAEVLHHETLTTLKPEEVCKELRGMLE
ncbi:MAG: hypothetical protein Q8O86_07260 [Dehalococcoidia bacterium]|nr:hypothetical protein [Dehalococcoidia bacterium]